jgi:hypothetical protein
MDVGKAMGSRPRMRGKPMRPSARELTLASVPRRFNHMHPQRSMTATLQKPPQLRGQGDARFPGYHTVQEENWPREARVGAIFDRRDGVRARSLRFAG